MEAAWAAQAALYTGPMAVVLMAWELGSGMGHLDRMRLIGDALRDRGHRVVFALRDLSRAHARIGEAGFELLQAPLWLPTMRHPPHLPRYSSVMAAAGWMDDGGLAGLIQAWRGLVRGVGADALVADHAPTALLATRPASHSDTPRAPSPGPLVRFTFGHAFEVPPMPGGRFPPMAWWAPAEGADDEPALLAATNRGLALVGAPALAALEEVFDGVGRCVLSLPEISHYPDPPRSTPGPDAAAPVLGPMYAGDIGVAPRWPALPGPRVFVYLAAGTDGLASTLDALRLLGWPAIVHATGLDAESAVRRGGPSVHAEPRPLATDATVREADLVITHGSIGTVSAALLAGVPQLALPRHMEQQMVSRRLADAGLGLMLTGLDGSVPAARAMADAMRQLLADPGCRQRTRAVAQRHAGEHPQRTAERAADLVHEALGRR